MNIDFPKGLNERIFLGGIAVVHHYHNIRFAANIRLTFFVMYVTRGLVEWF
jgi:hypothetical protein